MLKEARIVMPYSVMLTVAGEAWDTKSLSVHGELKKNLCTAFGGFTMTLGHGGWIDGHGEVIKDRVAIYDVAVDTERDGPWELIARFAIDAGRKLGQDSVYVRYPNGEVDIINLFEGERNDTADALAYAFLGHDANTPTKEDKLLDALTDEQFKAGAQRLLEDIFGKGNVVAIDMGDGRSASTHDHGVAFDTPLGHKHLPMPGEMWETVAGARVFVGKKATVLDGGWYVTVVDSGPTHDKPMFEYIVNLDGKLQPALPGHRSPRDLKRRIH